ncbi:MAG: hypothetical protein ACLP07_08855 [Terracidiphilus sp.]
MNQSEALSLAVEMLERVAPGSNYDARVFLEKLREIKATISPAESVPKTFSPREKVTGSTSNSSLVPWPRTVIVGGEEFCEIGRRTINGRELILMESCRDGGEAPAIIVDAATNETMLDEVCNGFYDYRRTFRLPEIQADL